MKKVKVIRSEGKTTVIYSDAPVKKARPVAVSMNQKAIPVYVMGKRQYYILPNGKMYIPRRSIFRIIRDILETPVPSFQFA